MAVFPRVITAEPETDVVFYIDDASTYPICRTQNGPFLYGGSLYVGGYVHDYNDNEYYTAVMKSADQGVTWTLCDHANAILNGDSGDLIYPKMVRFVQIGSKLWFCVNDYTEWETFTLGRFDMSTDTYDAFTSAGTSILNGSDLAEDRTFELSYGPNESIFLSCQEEVSLDLGPDYWRTWLKRYSIAANAWTSEVYLDGVQATENDTVMIGMRFDDSVSPAGDLHILFATMTHSNRGSSPDYNGVEIYYVSHDGTTLGTPTQIYTSGTPSVSNDYPLDANWWSLTYYSSKLYLVRDRYVSTGVYDVYVDTIDIATLAFDTEQVFDNLAEYYMCGYALAVDGGTDTLHLMYSYSKTTSPLTPNWRTIGHYARIDGTWEEMPDRYTYDFGSPSVGGININGTRNVVNGSRPPWGFLYFSDSLTVIDFIGCVCDSATSPSPSTTAMASMYFAY